MFSCLLSQSPDEHFLGKGRYTCSGEDPSPVLRFALGNAHGHLSDGVGLYLEARCLFCSARMLGIAGAPGKTDALSPTATSNVNCPVGSDSLVGMV